MPGETLIPGGRGEAFHPGIGYASNLEIYTSNALGNHFTSGEGGKGKLKSFLQRKYALPS